MAPLPSRLLLFVRWGARALAGLSFTLLVQDKFRGLELGAWTTVTWVLLGIALVVVVATTQPVLDRARTGPRLSARKVEQEIRTLRGRKLQVVLLPIYNQRDSGGARTTAKLVIPRVEVRNGSRGDPVERAGSWAPDWQGKHPGAVDFRPTHETHPLELAAKFSDEELAYIAGEPTPRLGKGRFEFVVSLRGDNVRKPARFKIEIENTTRGLRVPGVLEPESVNEAPEPTLVAPSSSRRQSPPVQSAPPPSPATGVPAPAAEPSLKGDLQQTLKDGQRLRNQIPSRLPGGLGFAYIALGGARTTGEDVQRWQAYVETLLDGDKRRRDAFLYDRPETLVSLASSMTLHGLLLSPLEQEMDRRLSQLEKVIRTL